MRRIGVCPDEPPVLGRSGPVSQKQPLFVGELLPALELMKDPTHTRCVSPGSVAVPTQPALHGYELARMGLQELGFKHAQGKQPRAAQAVPVHPFCGRKAAVNPVSQHGVAGLGRAEGAVPAPSGPSAMSHSTGSPLGAISGQ